MSQQPTSLVRSLRSTEEYRYPSRMAFQPRVTTDVELASEIYPRFPAGWRSPVGIMEGFLLAGALEIQARRRLNPHNPWDPSVLSRLHGKFQFDGLGSLIARGPHNPVEWSRPAISDDPAVNYIQSRDLHESGELIGRLVLIGLVWKFVDEVYSATSNWRSIWDPRGIPAALGALNGTILGQHGTALFLAAFASKWEDPSEPRTLTNIERAFLVGGKIRSGTGILSPSGAFYSESIWHVAFRLVERRSPDFYIHKYSNKLPTVEYILNQRATIEARGESTGKYHWPGWPPDEAEPFTSRKGWQPHESEAGPLRPWPLT